MRYAARLAHVGPRRRSELLLADADANLSFEDVGVLILVGVDVRRCQRTWGDRVLDDREQCPAGSVSRGFS